MLEKKDSASSGVLLLGETSRSLEAEEDDASHAGHQQHPSLEPLMLHKMDDTTVDPSHLHPEEPSWSHSHQEVNTESEEDEETTEQNETHGLLINPPQPKEIQLSSPTLPVSASVPSWSIPIINAPTISPEPSETAITSHSPEIYFDEKGEVYVNNKNESHRDELNVDNLLIQESGSQLIFPMDVSLNLDEEESLRELGRIPSTSTLAYEDSLLSGMAGDAGSRAPSRTLVINSAPAASKGILSSSSRINRKNSQVCFRESEDEATNSPLLSARNLDAPDQGDIGSPQGASLRKMDSDLDNEEEEEWEMVPPDGGWGWLVLAGSMLVNVLVPGTVKSFGVLFVEFLEVFNATPVAASWIPALCYFLYSSLGPVASVLSAKFSYRTVTILGGGFAAFGMILSFFANSIAYLYVSFGLLVGTGAGLAFPPGVFIVSSYFLKRRGLANGLCISGSAIGSIILPPLLRFLLNTYGYRGAVLIMGGLTFNVWVGAMFYHPVERHMKRVLKTSSSPKKLTRRNKNTIPIESKPMVIEAMRSVSPQQVAVSQPICIPISEQQAHQQDATKKLLWYLETSPDQDADYEKCWLTAQSASFIGPNIDKSSVDNSPSPLALREVLENSQPEAASSLLVNDKKLDWDFFSTLPPAKQRLLRLSLRPAQSQAVAAALHSAPSGGQLSRSFSAASNVSLSSFQYISTVHHGSTLAALQQNPPDNEFASTLTLRSVSHSCWESALDCCRCFFRNKNKDVKQSRSDIKPADGVNNNVNEKSEKKKDKALDLSLLKDSLYLVILLSNSTNAIGYTNFIILLPAYAIGLGFDKSSASLLLSMVAAFDLVGRIGGSALSDLHFMPRKYYYIGGLALSGAMLSLTPLMATGGYTYLAVSCAIFGLGSGTYVGVTAVLMADMLGAERLASSFGISLFLNGILQLLGPPLCGLALQQLQSYTPIFTTLGIVLLLGAAMWGFIPIIERKRKLELENNELV